MSRSFTLNTDEAKNLNIIEGIEAKSGSHFSVGDMYVDYESNEKDVELTDMTEELLTKKFLVFVEHVEI